MIQPYLSRLQVFSNSRFPLYHITPCCRFPPRPSPHHCHRRWTFASHRYVATVHHGYEEGKLARIVSSSRCAKGRLLHYFPRSAPADGSASGVAPVDGEGGGGGSSGASAVDGADDDGSFSDWCGWHHDHSSLTGAARAETSVCCCVLLLSLLRVLFLADSAWRVVFSCGEGFCLSGLSGFLLFTACTVALPSFPLFVSVPRYGCCACDWAVHLTKRTKKEEAMKSFAVRAVAAACCAG